MKFLFFVALSVFSAQTTFAQEETTEAVTELQTVAPEVVEAPAISVKTIKDLSDAEIRACYRGAYKVVLKDVFALDEMYRKYDRLSDDQIELALDTQADLLIARSGLIYEVSGSPFRFPNLEPFRLIRRKSVNYFPMFYSSAVGMANANSTMGSIDMAQIFGSIDGIGGANAASSPIRFNRMRVELFAKMRGLQECAGVFVAPTI